MNDDVNNWVPQGRTSSESIRRARVARLLSRERISYEDNKNTTSFLVIFR